MKTLVDSSGWIEFFSDGPRADAYAEYIADRRNLITSTIVVYEVYKKIKRERGEEQALHATAQLGTTEVIALSDSIALRAADLSLAHGLAMTDAIVYATARDRQARVVTGDADLKDLPDVIYVR